MANGQRQAPVELTISVVGSTDLVEQIMLSGTATSGPATSGPATSGPAGTGPETGDGSNGPATGSYSTAPPVTRRLVAVVYRNEQEAGDKVLRPAGHGRVAVRQPRAVPLCPAG